MIDKKTGSLGLFLRALASLQSNKNIQEVDAPKKSENIEPPKDIAAEENIIQPHFPFDINPQSNSFFPVVIIDRKMKILFANEACRNLFSGYIDLDGKYFSEAFGKSFGIDSIRQIRETILDGQNGYFWKGEADIKSRIAVSVMLKVFIFPSELETEDPNEFVVMFEDITEEKKKSTRATFLSLLEASKLKDRDTGSHILRVNHYSQCLSEALFRSNDLRYKRIDADFVDNIGFLASMHDLGKIGTPDDILNKKGPLEEWQRSVMQQHTINGGIILNSYPNKMAQEIASCHHERWDGLGYPYQLSEETIPLAARIVTIADVYDALRTKRSYKSALPHDVAVQKIVDGKGSHFDPLLVDVFVSVNEGFNRVYEENFDGVQEKYAS